MSSCDCWKHTARFQFDVGNVVLRLVRFASVLDLTPVSLSAVFYFFYTALLLLHRFVVTQFVAADGYISSSVLRGLRQQQSCVKGMHTCARSLLAVAHLGGEVSCLVVCTPMIVCFVRCSSSASFVFLLGHYLGSFLMYFPLVWPSK